MNDKHVLVTGGSGFLGGAIVHALATDSDVDDIAYTYRSAPLDNVDKKALGLELDLSDPESYRQHSGQLEEVTVLVHAAAKVGTSQDPAQDFDDQVVTNLRILNNLMRVLPNLQKIIYISSCSAELVGKDTNFYALGKLQMEQSVAQYAKVRGISHINLRFPQLYGPGEPHGTFIGHFIKALKTQQSVTLVDNGSVTRDVLYVQDAVGSVLAAMHSAVNGTFTIANSEKHTVREVLELLIKITGAQPTIQQQTGGNYAGSVTFESTADQLGYHVSYPLQKGLQLTVEAYDLDEGKKHVS